MYSVEDRLLIENLYKFKNSGAKKNLLDNFLANLDGFWSE